MGIKINSFFHPSPGWKEYVEAFTRKFSFDEGDEH
jgi:hypothetical protein